MNQITKALLVLIGFGTVCYSLAVLYRVSNSYDLRIYAGVGADHGNWTRSGVEIDRVELEDVHDCLPRGPDASVELPGGRRAGDLLVEIAEHPVPTFEHFVRTVSSLKDDPLPPGGVLPAKADPSEHPDALPIYQVGSERWVRVKFLPARLLGDDGDSSISPEVAYVRLQPIPADSILMSIAWFLVKMVIFGIGALVVWKRPHDLSAKLFFTHCCVTVVAFMGGFHWQNIAGEPVMFLPFILCMVLVPPLTVHFYMWFPQSHEWARRWPVGTLTLIYVVPAAWIVLMFWYVLRLNWDYTFNAATAEVANSLHWAWALGYAYIPVSAVIFVSGQGILLHRFFTSRTQAELNQVKWILAAAVLASFPLGAVLYLAVADKVEFALGRYTRPMMFVASLLFTLAYAVSITRYKLMQAGKMLNRGFLYFAVSFLAMALFCLLLALVSLGRSDSFDWLNVLLVGLTSMFLQVCLGLWGDRLQKATEIRFHREKYQLDKAMRRLGDAVDQLVEPNELVEQMLQSAMDAVSSVRGAVYLRPSASEDFSLVIERGTSEMPTRLEATCPLVTDLEETSMLSQWSELGMMVSTAARQLNELGCNLAISFEVNSRLLGVVLLGPKDDNLPYTHEDRNFLGALARTTSLALQSAQGHQTIEQLREDLQAKVQEIAEQRQQILFLKGELSDRQSEPQQADESADGDNESPPLETLRHEIHGASPAVREMLAKVAKIAKSASSVLIRGESGTGKELLARAIHENSPRREGPFVVVHCAALSEGLLESELFGHVKGAFTGADRDKIGRFEMADCGTLFLDEIGDINLETQTKLLRVLQEQAFERVGGVETIRVDVRLITATHRSLEELIQEEQFREDLYYRLNVISLWAPPLRDRGDDVIELAFHFLRMYAGRAGKAITKIDKEALSALANYSWPGNIRQLENAIERAVVLADGNTLSLADLPPEVVSGPGREAAAIDPARAVAMTAGNGGNGKPFTDVVNDLERRQLADALAQCDGNKSRAARMLGMPRSTLFSKLRKYGIG